MKFISLIASAALVACANAIGAAFGNSDFTVQAGKPFKLTWIDQVGPTVDLKLKNGDRLNLKDVLTIATGVSGKEFTWTPPAGLATDLYAFEIVDSGTGKPNYSLQFQFAGVAASSTSATSAATVTSTTSTTSTRTQTSSTSGSATSSVPSSTSTTGPSSSTSGTPRATQSGGTVLPPNSGIKYHSSPLALVAVIVATFFYLN